MLFIRSLFKTRTLLMLGVTLTLLLAACSQSTTPTNTPPVADAGTNQTVTINTTVTLDASNSSDADTDTLEFVWAFVTKPAGSQAVLSSTDTAVTSFMADVAGAYELSVRVSDGVDEDVDSLTVVAGAATDSVELTPGNTIIAQDGVVIGALEGSIDESVKLTLSPGAKNYPPLPKNAALVSEVYDLAAERDVYASGDFLVALPVPAGADTTQLALAFLSLPEDHNEDVTEPVWQLISGVYDPKSQYFITTLPFIAAEGRMVALVQSPAYTSPELAATPELKPQQSTTGFKVSCQNFDDDELNNRNLSCSSSDEADLEQVLEDAYADMNALGFAAPYLQREIDTQASSFNPNNPNIVFGPYLASLQPFRDVEADEARWPCGSRDDITNLGGYSSGSKSFFVCIGRNGVTTGAADTARHEFFHATQYGYKAVRDNSRKSWIMEGSASSSENSGSSMARNTGRPYHKIDVSLSAHDNEELYQYHAQDFWVYLGNRESLGLAHLQRFFIKGANDSSVNSTIAQSVPGFSGLSDAYWAWAKNQAFEKTTDLGGNFTTTTCTLDTRMANARVINYASDAPPGDTVQRLDALESVVFQLDFRALAEVDYSAAFEVLTSSNSVRVKLYDTADAATSNCVGTAENKRNSVSVSAGQSETHYLLVSNTHVSQSTTVTLRFDSPAPSLEIMSPQSGTSFEEGDTIRFLAVAKGFKGSSSNPDLKYISWSYMDANNVMRVIGTSKSGEALELDTLCDGTYNLTARTLYSRNNVTASTSITIRNPDSGDLPEACDWSVQIVNPTADMVFASGDTVQLNAIISDDHPETDEPLSPVIWRQDGPTGSIIGTGLQSSTKLGAGEQTIYVSYGNSSDSVTVSVLDAGTPPTASITPPEEDNSYFWMDYYDGSNGTDIPFVGAGQDAEDGTLAGSALSWSYRVKGSANWIEFATGTNATLSLNLVSPSATYELRLIARDSDGLTGTEIIEIYVIGPAS